MTMRKAVEYAINSITDSLNDLYADHAADDDFSLGQKYAYVECLEILQHCLPKGYRLDYVIEEKFPL